MRATSEAQDKEKTKGGERGEGERRGGDAMPHLPNEEAVGLKTPALRKKKEPVRATSQATM